MMNLAQRAAILLGTLIALTAVTFGSVVKLSDGPNDCGAPFAPKSYEGLEDQARGNIAEYERLGGSDTGLSDPRYLLTQIEGTKNQCSTDLNSRRTVVFVAIAGGIVVAVAGGLALGSSPTAREDST